MTVRTPEPPHEPPRERSFALPPDEGHGPGSPNDGPMGSTRSGHLGTVAAWAITLAMVVLMVGGRGGGPAPATDPDVAISSDDPVATALVTLQGRLLVGVADLAKGTKNEVSGEDLFDQVAQAIPSGPPRIRMRLAILAAELVGPARGLAVLEDLDDAVTALDEVRDGGFALEPADRELVDELRAHLDSLEAGEGGSLDADARARFSAELGWWGDLAGVLEPATDAERLTTMAPARRTVYLVYGGFAGIGLSGLIGLVLLILGISMAATGRLSLTAPLTDVGRGVHGRLLEVFAVWIVLFFALQLLAGLAAAQFGGGAAGQMAAAFAGFMLSLVALAWAPIRGVAAADLASVAGLNVGRGIVREVGAGVVGYLATLPLMAVGIACTFLLAVGAGVIGGGLGEPDAASALLPANGPAHPIVGEVGRSMSVTLFVLLTGAVAAPIVEEVFFRGCLHTHLRHALGRLGSVVAIAAATLVTAFIFAVIHPQGWIAVPALMSLAIGFSMVREWRGSVIAPVTMHAINNGTVLTGLTLLVA